MTPTADYARLRALARREGRAGAGETTSPSGRRIVRAEEISRRHRGLRVGLVDSVVMAIAERRRASAVATFDLRHFGAVTLRGHPRLLPRDLGSGD